MRRCVALLAIVALAGCTTATSTLSPPATTTHAASPPSVTSTSVSPTPPLATLTVDVPRPGQMVAAFGSVWVQSRTNGEVWRIAPNGDQAARIPNATSSRSAPRFNSLPTAIAAGFGSVWSLTNDAIVRIDPASNEVVGTIPVTLPNALAVGEGAVWVVSGPGQVQLLKIDPSTMHADVFARLGTTVGAIGVSAGYIWLIRISEAGGMDRIDPNSGELTELKAGYNDRFLVTTPRWLWLINSGRAQRIDPTDGRAVDRRSKPKAPGSIGASYSHGTLWINNGTAIGIDATSGAVIARIPAFSGAKWWWTGGIAQLGARVWLVDPAENRVIGAPIN